MAKFKTGQYKDLEWIKSHLQFMKLCNCITCGGWGYIKDDIRCMFCNPKKFRIVTSEQRIKNL